MGVLMGLDLSVNYGGLFLHSPIVVGSCPMTLDDQTRLSLESAGAGAIVLPSVFEEQILAWGKDPGGRLTQVDRTPFARSQRMAASVASMDATSYLAFVKRCSDQLAIPVIASINGCASGNCLDYARELQEAGAAGVELNVHRSYDRQFKSSGEIEDSLVSTIEQISRSITVPLFVKLDRSVVSLPHLARRCCSGAAGFVLYGRGPDTDICLDSLQLDSKWNLSAPGTAIQLIEPIMRVHSYCPAMSIAASGGISTSEDVAKVLLAGADVAMVTSELYRSGPDVIRTLIDGLIIFLDRHHFASLMVMQLERPIEFACKEERARYVSALSNRLGSDRSQAQRPALRTDSSAEPWKQSNQPDRWGHAPQCDRWGHPNSIGDEPLKHP
jgi:dihydroorotate dehydrogenase (fumarate)